MTRASKIEKFYGGLFLAMGLLWLVGIYIRSEGYRPHPRRTPEVSYQNIQKQLAERIRAQENQAKARWFSLRGHLPEVVIVQFRMIASGEFLCAILFLVAGLALLRSYPLRSLIAVGALTADLILKTLVWSYQYCVLVPLKDIFEGNNLLSMYFTPDAGVASRTAAFLAGIPLLRPGAAYYGIFYAAFWAMSLWIFTNLKTK